MLGLQILGSIGVKHVEAFVDSLLVVEQVANVYQCFSGFFEWIDEFKLSPTPTLDDDELSYPVLRKRERSLDMCAQDVQITRMTTI
jgi:hypothetical protein